MPALLIILGIILFFVIILSIPVYLDIDYTDAFRLSVQYLFIKINIYPKKDKPKKEKKKKEEKPKEEKSKEEEKPKEDKPKEKKENLFTVFYKNQGVPGIIELVRNCASYLGRFSGRFLKSIRIRHLRINISVSESDAAQTAIRYGKICAEIYPPLGFICNSCTVKDYKVNIFADYLGDKTKGQFSANVGIVLRSVINAGIGLVFRLAGQLLRVVFSNMKSANKSAAQKQSQKKPANNNSNMKGGQTQ